MHARQKTNNLFIFNKTNPATAHACAAPARLPRKMLSLFREIRDAC